LHADETIPYPSLRVKVGRGRGQNATEDHPTW
jgi:hypothetical protein